MLKLGNIIARWVNCAERANNKSTEWQTAGDMPNIRIRTSAAAEWQTADDNKCLATDHSAGNKCPHAIEQCLAARHQPHITSAG